LWQVLIAICLTSLVAAFVGSYLGRVSASSQLRKQIRELETEVASLTSDYSKVMALAKKISNRVALEDHRGKRHSSTAGSVAEPPPPGDRRAAKEYYLRGKTHTEIARMAMGAGQ
jgi:hypothetical protein